MRSDQDARVVHFERRTFPRAAIDNAIALFDLQRKRFAREADRLDQALKQPKSGTVRGHGTRVATGSPKNRGRLTATSPSADPETMSIGRPER